MTARLYTKELSMFPSDNDEFSTFPSSDVEFNLLDNDDEETDAPEGATPRKRNPRSLFKPLTQYRTISMSGNEVLYENLSGLITYLGIAFPCLGLLLGFAHQTSNYIVLRVIGGLILIAIGIFILKKVKYYSVINLCTKSIYKVLKINDKPVFKTKPFPISDIVAIGIDHVRRKPTYKGNDIFGIIVSLIMRDWVPDKPTSEIDGYLAGTGISYITKAGRKCSFNIFSEKIDADETNFFLAKAMSKLIGINFEITDDDEALVVCQEDNQYRFKTISIKPTYWNHFIDTLKNIGIIILCSAIIIGIISMIV